MRVPTDFGTYDVGESVVYRTRGDPNDRAGTVQPDGVETCGAYRLELQGQHKPLLITWPKVEHMIPVATATTEAYMASQEVGQILEGQGHYGRIKLEVRNPAPGVYFYGSPGISASVGPWMRNVWGLFHAGTPVGGLWAYFSRETRAVDHNFWYFAVELANEIHVVGGCTDFSGEGGKAKRLAQAFLERFSFELIIRPASNLVDLLVEGYGPFVLSQKEATDAEDRQENP